MVRLMLVLAPVMCIIAGIGVSSVLATFMKDIDGVSGLFGTALSKTRSQSSKRSANVGPAFRQEVAFGVVSLLAVFLVIYAQHCVWVTSEAYSSPSIVLSARSGDGSQIIFDDFREAYYWLRQNTPEDAKVSWLAREPIPIIYFNKNLNDRIKGKLHPKLKNLASEN